MRLPMPIATFVQVGLSKRPFSNLLKRFPDLELEELFGIFFIEGYKQTARSSSINENPIYKFGQSAIAVCLQVIRPKFLHFLGLHDDVRCLIGKNFLRITYKVKCQTYVKKT